MLPSFKTSILLLKVCPGTVIIGISWEYIKHAESSGIYLGLHFFNFGML